MDRENAVVYARVSTDHEDQIHSLRSQEEYYSEYAVKKGYNLLKVYADEGLTATSPNRKDFLNMIHDAGIDVYRSKRSKDINFQVAYDRDPLFNWIIVKDVSRFARNVNAIDIARKLRDDKNVYIDFENLGYTTQDNDWEFRTSLFLTFSQQESIDRSMKSKKAYRIKTEKGNYHMSNVLLGYKRNPDTKEYEIDEEEAKTVRYIFDQYVNEGKGTTEIADLCNDKGYKTKQGRRFSGNSVLRILKNEKFKGLIITNRYTHTGITGSYKRIILPEDEWNYNEDAIPNIVSPEMFDKAQEIRGERVIKSKNFGVKGRKVPKNEFYQKIFCGKCGADYVRLSSKKKRVKLKTTITEYFYSCRNRRNKMRIDDKCDNKGISHNVLVRELTEYGKSLHTNFNALRITEEEEKLNEILNKLDNKLKNSEAEKDKIKEQTEELDRQMSNVKASNRQATSEAVRKILLEDIENIDAEKAELNKKIMEFDTIAIENEKQKYINKYEEIVKFSKKKTFTFDDVLELVDGIYILEHREALVELRTPTLLTDDETYKGGTEYSLFPFTFRLN